MEEAGAGGIKELNGDLEKRVGFQQTPPPLHVLLFRCFAASFFFFSKVLGTYKRYLRGSVRFPTVEFVTATLLLSCRRLTFSFVFV